MGKSLLKISTRAPDQLGVAIRRIRKAEGMTQEDLSKKTGIQQRTISKIENGQMNTEISTLYTICSALGLELLVQKKSTQSKKKLAWMDE